MKVTRLQALRFVNEGLCQLYGVLTFLYRFGRLDLPIPTLEYVEAVSSHIGLLIVEIEQGIIQDFP